MFNFDCANDWGPYETLFRTFTTYNVQVMTADRPAQDYTIKHASQDHVVLTTWLPSDTADGSGPDIKVPYEAVELLIVY